MNNLKENELKLVPHATFVYRFPFENKHLLKKWIKAMRREKWKPSKNTRICEHHFLPSDYSLPPALCKHMTYKKYLKRDAVPSVFPGRVNRAKVPHASTPERSDPEKLLLHPATAQDPKSKRNDPEELLSHLTATQDPKPRESDPEKPISYSAAAQNPKRRKSSKNTARLDHSYANEKSPLELCAQYRKKIVEKNHKIRNLRKSKIRLEKNVRGLTSKLKAAQLLNVTLSNALRENFAHLASITNEAAGTVMFPVFASSSQGQRFCFRKWEENSTDKGNVIIS